MFCKAGEIHEMTAAFYTTTKEKEQFCVVNEKLRKKYTVLSSFSLDISRIEKQVHSY